MPKEIGLVLLKATDDSQDELKKFAESLRASGVKFTTRARTADSAGVDAVILAFLIAVGPEIASLNYSRRLSIDASGKRHRPD